MRRSREEFFSNPLRDPQDRRLPRIAGPCGLVIFGVTGDLSRKKLMPAVYDLANRGLLPPGFALVGFARRDWADQDFAQVVHESVQGARPHTIPRGDLEAARRGFPLRPGRLRRRRRVRQAPARRSSSWTPPAAPAATTRSTSRCRRSSSRTWCSSSRSTASPTARPGRGGAWSSRSRSATTCAARRS